jgi:predicted TIM-barrel fold metal-dependent hydrolase
VTSRESRPGITDVCGCVAPAMELIYENGTPEFRGQWPFLETTLQLVEPLHGRGDWVSPYLRLPAGTRPSRGHEAWIAAAHCSTSSAIPDGVLHQNAAGRLAALEEAGVARQLLIPGPSIDAAIDLPSNVAAGVLGAYNQYALRYCGTDPLRLKTVLQVHGGEPHWSAREIRELASEPSVAAVSICLPVKLAPDERNFRPVWDALEETGLPVLQRDGFAAGVWSPTRLLNYLRLTGVLQRHSTLRLGFLGRTAQWLDVAIDHLTKDGPNPAVDPRRIFAAVDGAHIADEVVRISDAAKQCLLWESNFPLTGGLRESLAVLDSLPASERASVLEANSHRFLHG